MKSKNCIYFYRVLNIAPIKISVVNYFNTLPFRWAIRHSGLLSRIELQEDIPSICAQKLKYKQVDIGLVPVALLNELDNYKIIINYCIGAKGKVDSVKLYSKVELEKITTITLDYQSKSSITLTKILAKEFWKINPLFLDAKPGFENSVKGNDAVVVIGDRAFDLNNKYKFEWDLSEEWKKFTGLPFVFAVWVLYSDNVTNDFIEEFNKVIEHGLKNIPEALKDYKSKLPSTNFDPLNYLTKKIDYNLDKDKQKALKIFLQKMKNLSL